MDFYNHSFYEGTAYVKYKPNSHSISEIVTIVKAPNGYWEVRRTLHDPEPSQLRMYLKNEVRKEYENIISEHGPYFRPKIRISRLYFTWEEGMIYCYEQYLMDKLAGLDVRWHGPDPEKFLEGREK